MNHFTPFTLYRGWPSGKNHVWSPFVIKVEARLRFAGVRYITDAGSTRSAPKGKIPYLQRGDESYSDSSLIATQLVELGVLPDLNARLSPDMKAHDLALRAMLEDKLYFYHTWERWTQNYYTMRDHVLWSMAAPARVVVGLLIYRNTMATLNGQGTGRHSAEEIAALRAEIWESVNGLLLKARKEASGDGPFWVLGGTEPTEADTSLFGFIVSVLICTAAPDSKKVVDEYPAIIEYASRIHDQYFPDYEKW